MHCCALYSTAVTPLDFLGWHPIPRRGQNWTTHNILSRSWHTWSWNNVPAKPVPVTNPLGTSEGPPMTITFKIPQGLFSEIHRDLSRPHGFAAERVGFIACGASAFGADGSCSLAIHIIPLLSDTMLTILALGP